MNSWTYDSKNSEFWNYLCGTNAALGNGFDITTRAGLEEFDGWYFEYYPYLESYLKKALAGKKSVLEIGLGLGTVSRYLSANTTEYVGLDIAPNVTSFLRQDFKNRNLQGEFINSSILATNHTFGERKFDVVIAIGSLHHSGMLDLAISNAISYLNPGGKVLIMIYNKFSIYQIQNYPLKTLKSYLQHLFFGTNIWEENSEKVRAINDSNDRGEAAPSTSYAHRKIFSHKNIKWKREIRNTNHVTFPGGIIIKRERLLSNLARIAGTDIYAFGEKVL